MKMLLGLLLTATVSTSYAQTTSSSTELSTGSQLKKMGLGLTLENETNSARDNESKLAGYDSYFLVEPTLKIDDKNSVSIGAQYNTREFEDVDREDKNRDALSESFIKYNYKALSSKTSLMDLKLQGRLYNNEDSFFKEFYSNDGNYQLRAYMGAPIAGKLFLNKYVTYLRLKRYIVNDNVNKYTRDYELRARVTPTYSVSDQVQLSTTFTYNHIFMVEKDDNENIDMSLGLRYMPSRTYAISLRVDRDLLETNANNDFIAVDKAEENLGYALTFNAYL